MTNRKRKGPKRDQFYDNAKQFSPLTQKQAEAQHDYTNGKNLLLCGYPGTGKTFIAVSFAIDELIAGTKESIRIVRCAVSTRDIGFQPGDEAEKMSVYERPYIPMVNTIVGRGDAYQILKNSDRIKFESTSFLRGVTYSDCVIIVDEFQNLSRHEINTIVTRMGKNSSIIFCGDIKQSDVRPPECGFQYAQAVMGKLPDYFAIHEMGVDDIVRSGIVKQWIIASEQVQTKLSFN